MIFMISVIVPVSNGEDSLHMCLNSILKQTYQDFEVICIYDDSTDSSLEILEYFTNKDSRFKIVENDINGSKNHAMNLGLRNVHGEYVTFLEADEWFDEKALEILVETSKKDNLDLLLFKNSIHNQQGGFEFNRTDIGFMEDYGSKVFSADDLDDVMIRVMINSPLKRFYSNSFIDKNNFRYPKKNRLVESVSFYNLFSAAENISFLDEFLIVSNEGFAFENNNIEKKSMVLNGIVEDYFPVIALNQDNVDKLGSLLIDVIGNFEDFLHKQNVYNYFNHAFLLFKLSKIKNCCNNQEECSEEFYQSVREEFIKMSLNQEILKRLPLELSTFYINVLNYDEMEEFFNLARDV